MTIIAPPPPAPPAESAPPTLTPGGRTALRVIVVLIATVLVSGTALTLGVIALGVSALRVVADTKNLPTDMRSLVIDTGGIPAAVRITTARDAAEPRAELRLLKSARTGDHTLTMTEDAGAVRLTVDGDGDGAGFVAAVGPRRRDHRDPPAGAGPPPLGHHPAGGRRAVRAGRPRRVDCARQWTAPFCSAAMPVASRCTTRTAV